MSNQTTPKPKNFKKKVVRGGIFLTLRKLVASALSLVSILVIARVLGPEQYGIVAIAAGTFYFFKWISHLGLGIYLVRQTQVSEHQAEDVLAFYTTVGFAFCGLIWLSAPIFGWWTGREEVMLAFRCLPLAVWFDSLSSVSIAMMERDLRFDEVGLIETVSQVTNYLVAIPWVLVYASFWGPVAGIVVQFLVQLCLARYRYPVRWRLRWRRQTLKPALRYGLTYSGSDLILSLRALTIPMIVSRLAGIEAAGLIGISIRFAEQLAMLRIVIRRMAISVMSKLLDSHQQVRRTISEGMVYQVLLVSPVCALFSCLSMWLVPLIFGERWIPSAQVFPLVAFSIIIATVFDLHVGTLYATGKNSKVAQFNAVYIGVLWAGSVLLIPQLGVWGYGLAEVISLPSYWLIHQFLSKLFGSPDYRPGIAFILATLPALFLGVVLPIVPSLLLFFVCYGGLLVVYPRGRKIVQKLWTTWQGRSSPV
ncbi:MAG: oligosaccharide flippase family protein [Cyanobacteria bacterium J06554_6]